MSEQRDKVRDSGARVRIQRLSYRGLFGNIDQDIAFPEPHSATEPSVLILSGRNGCGKTTTLRILNDFVRVQFPTLRRVRFESAELLLSNGDLLTVKRRADEEYPLAVSFNGKSATLHKSRWDPVFSEDQRASVREFARAAQSVMSNLKCELLALDRTASHSEPSEAASDEGGGPFHKYQDDFFSDKKRKPTNAQRVKDFLSEAQVNYRKFFAAEDLELVPRIIQRLQSKSTTTGAELRKRIELITARTELMQRFGLQTDEIDLENLKALIRADMSSAELALLESYVEVHENTQKSRDLIANRLSQFESIMDEFLIGKSVRVDAQHGLVITARDVRLSELDLSSGEFNFLYMMVSALLCKRTGSILAIDEPEMSLHISWQRRLIDALSKCASGAAPLFVFATHSPAIAAPYEKFEFRMAESD